MKTKLGDIASYVNGYAFKPSDWSNEGAPIIRIQDLTGNSYQMNRYNGNIDSKYEVLEGDILISWSASLGIYVWKGEKSFLNQHIFKVILDEKHVLKPFYIHQVEYILEKAGSQAHGATMKHLTRPVFNALPFYLPDLEVQKRIADELECISDLIDKHEQQLNALDELVKSRFIELFGDPATPGEKYKTCKLGEVADVKSSHRVFTTEFVDDGVPFYRGTEIGVLALGQQPENPYKISMKHYLRIADDDSKPTRGDLLLPSICNKGQVWMVNTDEPFYYKDGRVLCISPDRSVFDPKYLQFYMKMRTEAEYPKLGSGSTFAEFKIFQLKELEVDIPPMVMQKTFNLFADQVDKSKHFSELEVAA